MSDEEQNEEKESISLPIADLDGQEQQDEADEDDQYDGVLAEIDQEVNEHEIVLYMKGRPRDPMCGFSARAAAVLAEYGRPFHSVNVLERQDKREGIKEYSDWPTIPQVYIDGEFVGGSDILMEMHEKDQIEPLIEEAFE